MGAQTGERRLKADRAAQAFDLPPDGCNYPLQKIRTHMGFLTPGNILGCTVFQQRLSDKGAERVSHAGGQLSVGKGSGAAFPELKVRIGVKNTGLFKVFHRLNALVQCRAALQYDGAVSVAGKKQGCKQPCHKHPTDKERSI